MNENDPKRSNVELKINDLTTKIDELKNTRNRYARLDICEKVDAIIASN